jgi:hypothetical protein
MKAEIAESLEEFPPHTKRIALKLREIILEADPSVEETVKWNKPTFVSSGNIAFVYSYPGKDYVNLGFFRATELSDPNGFLEGSGKSMRHMKIGSEEDIDREQITAWVREAVELNNQTG